MKVPYHARSRGGQCSQCLLDQPADIAPELSASVGEGGSNKKDDVINVQTRLNRVGEDDGGPVPQLSIDGICGPMTKAAIRRFQKRHAPPLLIDGRIDRNKNTWKTLFPLSEVSSELVFDARAPRAAAVRVSTVVDAATNQLFQTYLFLVRHRIFEAIKALDVAREELEVCRAHTNLHPGESLHAAYVHFEIKMQELPTVDRCFHVVSNTMNYAKTSDVLRRLRKIYLDMVDVIIMNSFTTPAAERTGARRFLRIVDQRILNANHPGGAIADAPEQGWSHKNANVAHIRFGSAHINDSDVFSSLIHEMSHFVSDHRTYIVGAHVSGIYNAAFNDTHAQAVRNAFCYEWYAFLAAFKTQRRTPNGSLVLS